MRKIRLTNGKYALVDDDDFYMVSGYIWRSINHHRNTGYAGTIINKKLVLMHRMILDAKKGQIIDHINHNGIDNRRKNIRLCTSSQNCMNKIKRCKKTDTPYKGIYRGYKGSWRACIRINGKTIHLGSHSTQKEAALAYNKKAKEIFGEFALLNKIQRTKRP